ncbi:MAG TPA: TadE/TadG family type IV pilus assembly protein [Lacipirellulaceae bacterium]|jgi:Flp pilus assembly protein TadG
MQRPQPLRRISRLRRGTTLVETAIVLPVFMAFLLGLIELGHAYMVTNVMRAACREAARLGSVTGTTSAQVKQKALDMMGSACKSNLVTVYVKNAGTFDQAGTPPQTATSLEAMPDIEVSSASPLQLFMVRAKVNYNQIAIVPNIPILGKFLNNVVIQGQAFTRHE